MNISRAVLTSAKLSSRWTDHVCTSRSPHRIARRGSGVSEARRRLPQSLAEPKSMIVPRIDGEVKIDGVLDEAAWQKAARVTPFVRNDTCRRRAPRPRCASGMTQAALYLGWICDRLRHSGDVQRAGQPVLGGGGRRVLRHAITLDRYFELQWNPLGGTFDAIITNDSARTAARGSSKATGPTLRQHDVRGRVDGSVQNSSDRDQRWTVEVRIPFADLKVPTPAAGDVWRGSFYRFNRDHDGDAEP